jgi:hypothetical protein
MTEPRDERAHFYDAAACLDEAYRELGRAADDLRGIVSPAFLAEIAKAKDAINRAKDVIGA